MAIWFKSAPFADKGDTCRTFIMKIRNYLSSFSSRTLSLVARSS